jgi:hypothetical protein
MPKSTWRSDGHGKIPNASNSCGLNLACEGIFLVDHMHRVKGFEVRIYDGEVFFGLLFKLVKNNKSKADHK